MVVVVIKGVNKVLYRHHDRAHRKEGDYRDLSMAKTMRIDLERFKAILCLRGDDVTEPLNKYILVRISLADYLIIIKLLSPVLSS